MYDDCAVNTGFCKMTKRARTLSFRYNLDTKMENALQLVSFKEKYISSVGVYKKIAIYSQLGKHIEKWREERFAFKIKK